MTRRARRIIIPLIAALAATGILLVMLNAPGKRQPPANGPGQSQNGPSTQPATAAATAPGADAQAATAPSAAQPSGTVLGTLTAIAPPGDIGSRDQSPQSLGSIDLRKDVMHVELSRFGAGIVRIEYSDIWQTAADKLRAREYFKTLQPDQPIDLQKLVNVERYVLVARQPRLSPDGARLLDTPVLAASGISINGQFVSLAKDSSWTETAKGTFQSQIVDQSNNPVALITRKYTLGPAYDLTLTQRVQNLGAHPLTISWHQYGPLDLFEDRAGYIDRRRFHIGYLPVPKRDPTLVKSNDDDYVFERQSIEKQARRAAAEPDQSRKQELRRMWPTSDARQGAWELSWFGSTNRYFGLAVHPPAQGQTPLSYSLGDAVREIDVGVSSTNLVYTTLRSADATVAPGAEHAFDMGVFAGPLDLDLLKNPPYQSLEMSGMIVYTMSSCCTFLTFQWLAHLLLNFLKFLHDYIIFDWGIAIILLVVVVRTLLHPLTKKSQINMQRFGKQMSSMKPEIDKIQKKYAGDPQKLRVEQARLMREHGVNPLQMLGCLPMFLQMPIWIALWAMLYLAFDIRQQPALYGVFQIINNWQFLADLSSPDNFWILPGGGFTIPLVGWNVTSLNLLPLLMGFVFFFQQKYMSPPPTPNMTPEQLQQQKIMKVMMVVLFPLMLYKAPSGLTLYIFTSSCIGILESKYIRQHITEMELNPPKPREPGEKKPKDRLARMWADKLEAARAKRAQQQQGQRSFKRRK